MRKLFLLTLIFVLFALAASAEIPCQCGQESCRCFIQLGDEGPAVEVIQHALIAKGYLSAKDDGSCFDQRTVDAVRHFQEAHGLPTSGVMDDETLTLLLWGMLPEALDVAQPLSNGKAVWIPTDGGIKHHANVYCAPHLFTIHDPRLVSVRNALTLGYDPCKLCDPTGFNTDLSYYQLQ